MRLHKINLAIAFAAGISLAALGGVPAMAMSHGGGTCGTDKVIEIAEMGWPSAAALAHIHAIILGDGLGCNVELVTGDSVPTAATMLAKGTPAIAPELWTGTVQEAWANGVADGAVAEVVDLRFQLRLVGAAAGGRRR